MKNVRFKSLLTTSAPTSLLKRRAIASPPNEPPKKLTRNLNTNDLRRSGWMVEIACGKKRRRNDSVGWRPSVRILFNDQELGIWKWNYEHVASKLKGSLLALREALKIISSQEAIQDQHSHMITIMLRKKSHKKMLQGSLTPPSDVHILVMNIVQLIDTFIDCNIVSSSV